MLYILPGPIRSEPVVSLVDKMLNFQSYCIQNTAIFAEENVMSYCSAKLLTMFAAKQNITFDFMFTRRLNLL